MHLVASAERRQFVGKRSKVRSPVDESRDFIALGPGLDAGFASVDAGRRVSPFLGSEEPVAELHLNLFVTTVRGP